MYMRNSLVVKSMSKRISWGVMLFSLVIYSLVPAFAADKNTFNFSKAGRTIPSKTTVSWKKQIQQGYDFKIWMANDLILGRKAFPTLDVPPTCGSVGIGCEYPVGSCYEHLYGAGPWIGGVINGTRHVTEVYNDLGGDSETVPDEKDTLRDHFWETSISDSSYDVTRPGYYKYSMNRRGFDDDGDGKIDEDELDGLDNDGDWIRETDDIGADGIPDSLEIGCKGIYNAITNPDPADDDYEPSVYDSCHPNPDGSYPLKSDKNKYTEKNGIPDHGEPHVDEDYAAVSDHDVYVSSTDTATTANPARHHKMGIKIFQKSYAWNRKEAKGILTIDYYFVNIGQDVIKNVYVALYADMDVGPIGIPGYFNNNFAALFTDLHTGFIHNGVDRGSTPLGLTVLAAPRPFAEVKYIWNWFDFSTRIGPGANDSMIYAWISGEKGLIWPIQPMTQPSDTRFFSSLGPITAMNPGDTLKMTVAFITGDCLEQCDNSLKNRAINAIRLYQRGFQPPLTPPSPRMKTTEGFRKVHLEWGPGFDYDPRATWDDSSKTAESFPTSSWRRINPPPGHTRGGRIFEGYRVYRSEYPSGDSSTFSLLAQYDVKDDQFGYNVGLDSTYVDSNLVIGKTYWYSVTSFSIPDLVLMEIPDSNRVIGIRHDTTFSGVQESSIMENRMKVVATRAYGMNSYPTTFKLYEAFPNPFNPTTLIMYDLPKEASVSLKIYNILGEEVITLVNALQLAGSYEVPWNGSNSNGQKVASGLYFCRVIANSGTESFMQTSKLLMTK